MIVVLVGGTLSAALWLTRSRPGETKLVLLGAAAGREEVYEVWVRPGDEARGREVLRLWRIA